MKMAAQSKVSLDEGLVKGAWGLREASRVCRKDWGRLVDRWYLQG